MASSNACHNVSDLIRKQKSRENGQLPIQQYKKPRTQLEKQLAGREKCPRKRMRREKTIESILNSPALRMSSRIAQYNVFRATFVAWIGYNLSKFR